MTRGDGPLLPAHDLGTCRNKATLVTPEGRIVGAASAPYTTCDPRQGWAEQDPEEWWAAVAASTRARRNRRDARSTNLQCHPVSGLCVDRRPRRKDPPCANVHRPVLLSSSCSW